MSPGNVAEVSDRAACTPRPRSRRSRAVGRAACRASGCRRRRVRPAPAFGVAGHLHRRPASARSEPLSASRTSSTSSSNSPASRNAAGSMARNRWPMLCGTRPCRLRTRRERASRQRAGEDLHHHGKAITLVAAALGVAAQRHEAAVALLVAQRQRLRRSRTLRPRPSTTPAGRQLAVVERIHLDLVDGHRRGRHVEHERPVPLRRRSERDRVGAQQRLRAFVGITPRRWSTT